MVGSGLKEYVADADANVQRRRRNRLRRAGDEACRWRWQVSSVVKEVLFESTSQVNIGLADPTQSGG